MTSPESKNRLSAWFQQWRLPLRKFLIGKGTVPTSDLDDVAQEVFLRLMRYDRTELIEHPQAYLYKMATNVAAEWSLRVRYARPHEAKWLVGLASAEQTEEGAHYEQVQDELERAILTLPPRQREVLKLQFFESLSRTQIAERLGLSERAVKRIVLKS